MKLRSKLLMAAVSLLTVSVAATATSAYAWYAANRQTTASLSNVSVRSTETNIAVSLVTGEEKSPNFSYSSGSGESSAVDKIYTITTNQTVSDVSGVGNGTFVKPYLDAAGTSVVGWHDPDSVKANFYKFTLNFHAAGGDKAVNLYFSGNSTISATGNTDDLTVPSAARLSAVVGSDQKLVYTPKDVVHTYIDGKKSDGSGNYIGALSGLTLTNKNADAKLAFEQGTKDLTANTTDTTKCHGLLGSVTPKIGETAAKDLEVTFYIWVEGTATTLGGTNTNTSATASLTSNLEFYTI